MAWRRQEALGFFDPALDRLPRVVDLPEDGQVAARPERVALDLVSHSSPLFILVGVRLAGSADCGKGPAEQSVLRLPCDKTSLSQFVPRRLPLIFPDLPACWGFFRVIA